MLSLSIGDSSNRSPAKAITASATAPAGTRPRCPARAGRGAKVTSCVTGQRRAQRVGAGIAALRQQARRDLGLDHGRGRDGTAMLLGDQRQFDIGGAPASVRLTDGHLDDTGVLQSRSTGRDRTRVVQPRAPAPTLPTGRRLRRTQSTNCRCSLDRARSMSSTHPCWICTLSEPRLSVSLRLPTRGSMRAMHFQLDDDAAAFRAKLRAHLDEAMTPELAERLYRSGVAHDDDFAAGLVENGLFAPGWPTEFGGGGSQGDRGPVAHGRNAASRRAGLPVGDHANGGLGDPSGRHPGDAGANSRWVRWTAKSPSHWASPNQSAAPMSRRRPPRRSATATIGSSTAPRCSPPTVTSPTMSSYSPGPVPTSRSTRGSPCFWSRSTRRSRGPGGVDIVWRAHQHHLLQRRARRRRLPHR